jgi:hypothetical protein
VALANPTGLYIQVPDLSGFTLPSDPNLPDGASAQDCWQVVRGGETLIDPITQQPYGLPLQGGNFVLHAVFQIPSAWIQAGVKFTVGDILDANKTPIQWGGQVVQQMFIGLWARPIPASIAASSQNCVLPPSAGVSPPPQAPTPPSYAQPLQLFHLNVWKAYFNTMVANPMAMPISLASNSTLIAPLLVPGVSNVPMALVCATTQVGPQGQLPIVNLGPDVTVTSVSLDTNVFYAVPGNSYPSQNAMLNILVSVSPNAALGLRGLALSNYGDPAQMAMPGMINIVAGI